MSLFASEAESDPLCDGDDDEDEEEMDWMIPESIELCFTCRHSFAVESAAAGSEGGIAWGGTGNILLLLSAAANVSFIGFFFTLEGSVLTCAPGGSGGGGSGAGSSLLTGGLFLRLFRPVAGKETRCRWNPDRSSTDCVLRTVEGGTQPVEMRPSTYPPPHSPRSSELLLPQLTLLTSFGRMGVSGATCASVGALPLWLDRVDLGLDVSLEEQLRLSASSSSSLMRSSSSWLSSMSSSTEKLSGGGGGVTVRPSARGTSAVGCCWI